MVVLILYFKATGRKYSLKVGGHELDDYSLMLYNRV